MLPARVAGSAAVIVLSAALASCGGDTAERRVEHAPAISAQGRPAEPQATTDYKRTLSKLEALVASGRREMVAMGELSREAAISPAQFSNQIQLWDDLDSEWSDDLNTIEGLLPEKPLPGSDPVLKLIHDDLVGAIAELRQVPFTVSGRKVPSSADREALLSKAEEHLRSAHRSLYASR
jgi:hypothetical protein